MRGNWKRREKKGGPLGDTIKPLNIKKKIKKNSCNVGRTPAPIRRGPRHAHPTIEYLVAGHEAVFPARGTSFVSSGYRDASHYAERGRGWARFGVDFVVGLLPSGRLLAVHGGARDEVRVAQHRAQAIKRADQERAQHGK